ncbi:hypothetical protein PRNP1_002702 [Phytophthora ramorum]
MMQLSLVFALLISAATASDELAALEHPVLASSNLLDSDEFFVCGSKVPGMNGHYVLQPPAVVQSDPDTPRRDTASDFRLFRHNGFWMLADVEPWPPVTHFRCDPTKTQVIGIDVAGVCGLGQSTPPRIGYSPADPTLGDAPLTLQRQDCHKLEQTEQAMAETNNNFSTRKEEL